mgnify:CR=1 FL=1
MKGIVEIYGTGESGKRDLLYQGENMTTVGFSENIVDMLTTPSSISIGTDSVSGYLDPENYIVNAFSMSKAKNQFLANQHSYSTTNLLHNSDLQYSTQGWFRTTQPDGSLEVGTNMSYPVVGSTFGSTAILLESYTSGGVFSQPIGYDGASGAFSESYFSGTDFVFSLDVKFNRDNPPIQVSSTLSSLAAPYASTGLYVGYSQLALSCNGEMHRLFLQWDNSGTPSIYNTGVGASALGGVRSLGGGWYRAFVHGAYLSGGDAASSVVCISPCLGPGSESLVDSSYITSGVSGVGSMYINKPQLELGIHPTNYVKGAMFAKFDHPNAVRDDRLAYSRLNSTPPFGQDPDDATKVAINYYVLSDSGLGPTLSGVYDKTLATGVSAYIPFENKLVPTVNPEDRDLVAGAITPVEEAFGVQITQGQNSACQHLWDRLYVSSFDDSWTYTSGYSPVFGRHLTYVGTYCSKDNFVPSGVSSTFAQVADGTSIKATNWVHYLSSWDTVAGYANPASSLNIGERGLLTAGTTAGMPDMYGYISILNNATSAGPGNELDTADNWAVGAGGWYRPLIQSEIVLDFSSTGEVTYHMRLLNMSGNIGGDPAYGGGSKWSFGVSAGMNSDEVLLNLFGGVNVMGLWGLDLKKIREDLAYLGPQEGTQGYPFVNPIGDRASVNENVVRPTDPYRKYKLYSKKVLTDNMVKNEGFGTSAGIFGNYQNLDMYWRLKFL